MTAPERTAWKLLEDITDRRGWRQAWEGFDEAIKDEIFAAFIVIISKETTIVAIDRKALAEKLVQILREEGLDSPYIDAADLSDVTLDGWWNLERVAEKLAEYIESQRET
jgi:outer membrane PBP1 activator LpoA protein